MKIFALLAFEIAALALVLAGCAGLSPQVQPMTARPEQVRSAFSPTAARGDLLYVSDSYAATVDLYSGSSLKQVGALTGFSLPATMCVDKAQNVYVVDIGSAEIFEYAHGGTAPIATRSDPTGFPFGCAVDPVNGDVAVANEFDFRSTNGDVLVFPSLSGTPKQYFAPNTISYFFLGYDSRGNLFLDGTGAASKVYVSELPHKGSTFKAMSVDVSLGFTGAVQWDGKYLAVGDQARNLIYRFAVSGTKATKKGSTKLGGANDVVQFFIRANVKPQNVSVVGIDYGSGMLAEWPYPAGGAATKTIGGFSSPLGVVASAGKK